jgi:hypothetical protein
MYLYRYTSRPARYGAIVAHTISEFLHNVNVDLSGVEDSLADKVAALTAKVDELEARLLAYDESIDETPSDDVAMSEALVTKPKAKRKPRAKK